VLEAIAEVDARDLPIRGKLHAIASFIIDSYQNDPDLMKVIIVEVTRAANTFGRAHLEEISQAYEGIAAIIREAQDAGTFRNDFSPEFATLCFYGAIEQLLTAWIFEAIEATPETFDQAKRVVVETVCGGLEVRV
jgi:TetR/AcrR family fatty acid metabolism transcriptional regulator